MFGLTLRAGLVVGAAALAGGTLRAQPPAPSGPPPDKDAPIACEFRVFDGEDEVTAETSIHMFPAGARDNPIPVTTIDGRFVVHVPPAIYDARIVRLKQGQVTNIRWTEQLVITHYPLEKGRHLEVVNFRPRFGALQIVSADGGPFEMSVFPPGTRDSTPGARSAGRIVTGVGYQLLVAQAGRYDVRIRKGSGADVTDRWLLEVEVPSDRTRLKTTDGS